MMSPPWMRGVPGLRGAFVQDPCTSGRRREQRYSVAGGTAPMRNQRLTTSIEFFIGELDGSCALTTRAAVTLTPGPAARSSADPKQPVDRAPFWMAFSARALRSDAGSPDHLSEILTPVIDVPSWLPRF